MMSLHLSKRNEWVLQSEIRNMSIECDRQGGINLSQGICDTEVPIKVRSAAKWAIDEMLNSYTRFDGLPELREAIARKYRLFNEIEVDPEKHIVVSAGSTGALYCACLALLEPGDEVIVFEPYYGYHISTLIATEAVPIYVSLSPPGWTFTEDNLERVLSSRTRAIVLNTPANPTGKVFTKDELEVIRKFTLRHDLFVFTDEIYEFFVYDGNKHISPATLPGMQERTITISGLSKTFSITGWRIGYSISDTRWTRAIGYFNDLIYVCAPAPLQMGVAKGLLELGPEYYKDINNQYSRKRDRICEALIKAGLEPYVPGGAYYVLADISRVPGRTGKERAMKLLELTGVACVPGAAFYNGARGENLGRFCFSKQDDVLEEACKRIERLRIP